ncbi:hypothetical protein TWF506_007482 [Arthrobotrys conoides]|uniref:Uncharacterized protein n=1 Tax=Arthrobotrys conoides TaxID=74498 RepID=A0AAN8NEP4_9PEZI
MLMAYSQSFLLLLFSYFSILTNSQSTTLTTSTTTETWIIKDVIFSTVVTRLPWCPLPTAGAAVSASGPIVVQLSFRANVTDGSDSGDGVVTFVMDRNGNDIVVSSSPLVLSLNTSFVLQEFSNTPQVLYFSLPANLTSRKLGKRFDELLPVFISDQVPSDAIFEGWFEDIDGEFFIRVLTSEGELLLGFTVCPTDGTAASGQKVYVYDLSLGVPNTDQCIRAAANTLPYPLWTASSTSLPTGISLDPFNPEDGATTPTTRSGASRSSRTGSSGAATTTSGSGTGTNTITSRTIPTNTGMSITSNTSSGGSRTSSSGDSSSDSGSSMSSNSSTTDTRIYTTTTFWTTGVPDGTTSATSTTNAADATVTVSEYQPYPSSIKILSTRDGDTSSAIYYIKAIFNGNWLPVPPSIYEDTQTGDQFLLNMVWVLNKEGHLFSPIYGPRYIQGRWDGLGYNYTIPLRTYIVGSKTTATDIPDFGGMIIRVKRQEEMLDTDVLLAFDITSSGLLTLNSNVNTTAGYGIWACEETGQYWGITDGSDRYCQWDKITAIHMQGNPAVVDSQEDYYGFITTDGASYTAGLGDGPTVTRHRLLQKSVATTTVELTAGEPYYITVGTGLNVATATVSFGQRVERSTVSNAWNITQSVSSTVIGPASPTKTVIEYLAPSGFPMFRMFWVAGVTSDPKYFALSTNAEIDNKLLLYGDANTDPDTQRIAEFWSTPNGNDLIARGYDPTHRYLNPTTAYFDSATNGIKFYPYQQNPSGTELLLFDYGSDADGNWVSPRQPTNAVGWGSGDLSLWMCGRVDMPAVMYPSGPNEVFLGTDGSSPSSLGLAANCGSIGNSFGTQWFLEKGLWAQGTYWKRHEDGAWRNDDGVAYHEFVATQEESS